MRTGCQYCASRGHTCVYERDDGNLPDDIDGLRKLVRMWEKKNNKLTEDNQALERQEEEYQRLKNMLHLFPLVKNQQDRDFWIQEVAKHGFENTDVDIVEGTLKVCTAVVGT